MSTANRVIKNTMFLYVRMGISIIFSFFTTRILLQSLGASDYGLYNVVAGALSMLGFLSASMSSSTQRFISYAEGEGKNDRIIQIFNNAVFLHRVIAIAVCLFFVCAGFVFFNGVLNIPEGRVLVAVLVYGCMIFSTIFAITIAPYDAVLNAHENMKYYSILGITDIIFKFLIAIVVLFTSNLDQLLLYGILMAGESWLFRFITQRYCYSKYSEVREINHRLYVKKETLKEMTSFAGWNLLNIGSGMICLYGINIVVNHYFGTTVNAALGVATQLSGVIMGLTSNMSKALSPIIVKNEGAKKRDTMIKATFAGCRFSFLVFSIVSIPVIFNIDAILNIWLKDIPLYTSEFCVVMMLSLLFEQLFLFLQQAIFAEGNIKPYCILRSIVNLIPIPLCILLFKLGYNPTVSWWCRFAFFVVAGSAVTYKYAYNAIHFSKSLFYSDVIRPSLITLLAIFLFCYFSRYANINVFVSLVIEFFVSIVFGMIGGLKKTERSIIYNLISNRINRVK